MMRQNSWGSKGLFANIFSLLCFSLLCLTSPYPKDIVYSMLIRKGYRDRLKTDALIANALMRFAGSCRFVWNKALALQHGLRKAGTSCLRYVQLNASTTHGA